MSGLSEVWRPGSEWNELRTWHYTSHSFNPLANDNDAVLLAERYGLFSGAKCSIWQSTFGDRWIVGKHADTGLSIVGEGTFCEAIVGAIERIEDAKGAHGT